MQQTAYHKQIVDYYRDTEHAYRDSWDLDNSLAIHYGYKDERAKTFRQSLLRMNEVMMEIAAIGKADHVLDAGCGIGGSSIFLSQKTGCRVTGISLSERQVEQATQFSRIRGVSHLTHFAVADYCDTRFPSASFDVVWGCESICYAEDKSKFIQEAFRLLKPGGRLIIADGFISKEGNNEHPFVRQWLDGWQVNHLVTAVQFSDTMNRTGFTAIQYRDITAQVRSSAKRLYRFYFLARLYLFWKKFNFSGPPTEMQRKNIFACKFQHLALKKGLWQYGIILGTKPATTC